MARDRLTLDMDLTSGVSIAPGIVETLDLDADHAIASSEAEAYGRSVLSDLHVTLDGSPVGMTLIRIEIPAIDEIRNGLGTIRLRAEGRIEVGAGRHRVSIFNNHRPDASVYMVNALVPDDPGVHIVSQTRDRRQQAFHLETAVSPQWPVGLLWAGMCGAGLIALAVKSRKSQVESR